MTFPEILVVRAAYVIFTCLIASNVLVIAIEVRHIEEEVKRE